MRVLKMKKLSLAKKFILYSFFTFITTAISLILILSYNMQNKVELLELAAIIIIVMFVGLILLYVFILKNLIYASDTLSKQNKELTDSKARMEEALRKLEYSYRETISAASTAIDARDTYTAGHSKRVADIACKISRELGYNDSQIKCVELAALFHDIGKIGVPDNILNKPGKLDDEEFEKIKIHSLLGYNILKNIEFLSAALPAILYHHERPDGKGYPEGLKDDEIPIEAAIIAIADTYDAMTSDRTYRKALSHEFAIEEIKKKRGIQFKKEVVDAFIRVDMMKGR
jgi:putative nucleotidyltransferase with HDIG domain